MPDFNKLTGSTDFPNPKTINTYQYANEIDYSRFDNVQMDLMLCNVPWDVGEAHVGQRTISGIGNVVYFGTSEARDQWFAAIPDEKCHRWQTKYRQLHRDLYIDVELPFDVAARYNYLKVHYEPIASKDDLLKGEILTGKRDWFWFVREVEMRSNNTTRLYLLDDAFQTWIYDVNIEGMVLERGHAPMFDVRADDYLQDPVNNNRGLLTEDVNFGSASVIRHIDVLALNSGDVWCCIATSANPKGDWGSKAEGDWRVPGSNLYTNNGVPSVYVFAIEPGDLQTFMNNAYAQVPQFKQTVQGIFFVPKNMVSISSDFEFCGVGCAHLTSSRKRFDLSRISKSQFGYDSRYAEIAKLYTSPYAHIEVTDESGNVDVIKIEDTTGTLEVSAALSLAYPFITIDAHLLGTGGATSASVTFHNVTSRTFDIAGSWYETLRSWNVPTFAVTVAPYTQYDYSTHFDRAQRKIDYDTEYANASASATASKADSDASSNVNAANTKRMAQAAKTNADRSATNIENNATAQQTANASITSTSNLAATKDAGFQTTLANSLNNFENGFIGDTTNAEIDAKIQSAAVGAGGALVGGAVSGAMSGGAIGAVGGLVSGAISAASSGIQTAVATNLSETQAGLTKSTNTSKTNAGNNAVRDRTGNQNTANTDNTETTNLAIQTTSNNNAATTRSNASTTKTATDTSAENSNETELANNLRDYNTAISNAGRNKARAEKAIENDIAQARLRQPFIYGTFADGQSATTKPIALFAHVVTQSQSAIESAGDEFLRYGYMYEKQWAFNGNWNIGKYFTYWKLKDFWVRDLTVPDLYMDKLRFFLFGGVTIWRKPEHIGKVSIYDNFDIR